jgi:hypothetical protein
VGKTLTIRIDREQDAALTERAEALGQTRSELVRTLIAKGLEAQPLGQRVGHLRGHLALPAPATTWARRIKRRNWR